MHNKVSIKVTELLEPVVSAMGYELVGVEYLAQGRHSLLRLYIDSESGITLDDCERVSHQASGVLDVEDPISGVYNLEVSSPGLDRPLMKLEHFQRFVGHKIKLVSQAPINGRRRFTGLLSAVRDQDVVLEVDGVEVVIPIDAVEKANIIPEF